MKPRSRDPAAGMVKVTRAKEGKRSWWVDALGERGWQILGGYESKAVAVARANLVRSCIREALRRSGEGRRSK